MIKRRYVVLLLIVLLIGVGLASLLVQKKESVELTIDFKNVASVSVSELAGEHDEESANNTEPINEVTKSGTKLTLVDGEQYLLSYKGAPGYASDQQVVTMDGNKTVSFNPSYSSEKLKELLTIETPAIQAALKEKYSKINLYVIQPGELYQWGDWYGTTLVYNGPYTPYRDTLRVVLKKEGGKWIVMTDPPYLSLSKFTFPDIPLEVLDSVNEQPTPKPKAM